LPLLERCVASLMDQEGGPSVELRISVISNGCDALASLPVDDRIEQIRLTDNRGFAGGHNAGICRALERGADYVLLFNSDATAEPGLVRELVAAAAANPGAAFLGPLLVRAKEPDRVESAGQAFDVPTGRHTEIYRGWRVERVDLDTRKVDAVSGCALLARRGAIEMIGLLDEKLFAYFEDMDWCLRARRAGYDVLLVPRARVLHVGEGSTGGASALSTYYSVRNHTIVAARYGGALTSPLVLAYHLAFLVRSRERRTKEHFLALARGAWAAWSGERGAMQTSAHRH
jgi:GT2 family glycosyltransferase